MNDVRDAIESLIVLAVVGIIFALGLLLIPFAVGCGLIRDFFAGRLCDDF